MHTPKKPPFGPTRLPPDRRQPRGVFAKAVGSHVPKLTAAAFERFGFHSAEIMAQWPRIAGADVAAYTAPERIKWPKATDLGDDGSVVARGAVLHLRVEPARALDVQYKTSEIIDRINRYFGYRAIGQIKIIQAPLHESGAARDKASPQPRAVRRSLSDTGADTGVDTAAAPIPETTDDGLKSALEALWTSIATERARR